MENIEKLFKNDVFIKKFTSLEIIKEKTITIILPSDYLAFLEFYDGGEGFTYNEQSYLVLYGISDIVEINSDLHNELNYPSVFSEYIFFGKDAGPTYYGFKKSDKLVYEIPVLISCESEIEYYSDSFSNFLQKFCGLLSE